MVISMIFYPTKQTIERFNIPMFEDLDDLGKAISAQVISKEQNDPLIQWGCKLFYFDRRKCLQVVNFACKFTIFLVDVKVKNFKYIPDSMFEYLFDYYSDNKKMTRCLELLAEDHPFVAFAPLTDKKIIATLNHTQSNFALDGYRFYDYIKNGILHSKQICRDVNNYCIFSERINGKRVLFSPGKRFEELLRARYLQV